MSCTLSSVYKFPHGRDELQHGSDVILAGKKTVEDLYPEADLAKEVNGTRMSSGRLQRWIEGEYTSTLMQACAMTMQDIATDSI